MQPHELLDQLEQTFAECHAIAKLKNQDYGAVTDAFNNFTFVERLGIPCETGILTRFADKVARIANLMNKPPAVAGESLDDTILDAINYLAILRAWLQYKHRDPVQEQADVLPVKSDDIPKYSIVYSCQDRIDWNAGIIDLFKKASELCLDSINYIEFKTKFKKTAHNENVPVIYLSLYELSESKAKSFFKNHPIRMSGNQHCFMFPIKDLLMKVIEFISEDGRVIKSVETNTYFDDQIYLQMDFE